jgi:protein-disulfide isomerase
MAAARASVCADRQGTFWAMHDRLFTSPGRLDEASLRSAAAANGLNMEKFDACMRSDEVVEQVRKDMLVGRMVGVSGTPAFFLNRQPVDSVAALESAVERLLGGVQ